MLKITKEGNSLIVEGIDNGQYPNNGKISFPLNSIILTVEEDSDIVTFRSASNNDVLFSGVIDNIQVGGKSVTKDNIGENFGSASNAPTGGDVDAYTKAETDSLLSKKADTTSVDASVTDLDNKISAKADKTSVAQLEAIIDNVNGKLDTKADADETYTKADVNSMLNEKADNGVSYTKTESDGKYYKNNENITIVSGNNSINVTPTGIQRTVGSNTYDFLTSNGAYTKSQADNRFAAKGDLTTLEGKVTTNETNISDIQTNLGNKANSSDVTALATRVGTVETNLDGKYDKATGVVFNQRNVQVADEESKLIAYLYNDAIVFLTANDSYNYKHFAITPDTVYMIDYDNNRTEYTWDDILKRYTNTEIDSKLNNKADSSDLANKADKTTLSGQVFLDGSPASNGHIFDHYRAADSVTMQVRKKTIQNDGTMGESTSWTDGWSLPMATTQYAGMVTSADKVLINSISSKANASDLTALEERVAALETQLASINEALAKIIG